MKSYEEIEAMLVEHIAQRIGKPADGIDCSRRFDRLGLDSADAIGLIGELEDFIGRPLSASLPYTFPTIELLARALADGGT